MKMVAHYDDYNEDFRVDLWEEGKGLMPTASAPAS
jgi:hypothetical protein